MLHSQGDQVSSQNDVDVIESCQKEKLTYHFVKAYVIAPLEDVFPPLVTLTSAEVWSSLQLFIMKKM